MQLLLLPETRNQPIRPALFDDNEEIVELVSRYLRSRIADAKGYSPKTIELYGKHLKSFCEFLAADGSYGRMKTDEALAIIPGGVIDQYLVHSRKRLQETTLRVHDVVLKGFFEWLTTAEAGKVRESSGYESGKLKTRGGKRKMPRYVLKDQLIQLLHGLNHEPLRCAVHFLYDSGLRVSELPRVTKAAIDTLDNWPEQANYLPLLVQGSKGRGGRQIKERYVLISRAIYERIKRYHSTIQYRTAYFAGNKSAFLNSQRRALSAKTLQKAIADAARRAGLPPRTTSPHRLRHGTALAILEGEDGQDYLEKLVLIQIQFGHSSIKTTEAYTHIPPSLFLKVGQSGEVKTRFQEAQDIYDKTYLPLKNQKERRGRPRKARQEVSA